MASSEVMKWYSPPGESGWVEDPTALYTLLLLNALEAGDECLFLSIDKNVLWSHGPLDRPTVHTLAARNSMQTYKNPKLESGPYRWVAWRRPRAQTTK